MGKNRRHGKQKAEEITAVDLPNGNTEKIADDLGSLVAKQSNAPTSLLSTPVQDSDDRRAKVLEEVKRRKALADAAVESKAVPEPHNRITFYPFAYALREGYLHYCWFCLKEGIVNKCSGKCEFARFCDQKCEQLARKDHDPECKGYKRLKADTEKPDVEVRLLGRIAHRYKQIRDGVDKKIPEFYTDRTSQRTIMDIWSHESEFANDKHYTTQFNEIYEKLTKFYSKGDLPSRSDVFKLHCRDFVNRHAISDLDYQNEIGKGLYLDLCAYDHSCCPDTVFFSQGFKSVLVGLKAETDISDNRKHFYSYVDLMSTLAQRQKQLQDTWFFKCECSRCVDPMDHLLSAIKCQFCAESKDLDIPLMVQGQKANRSEGRILCPNCGKVQESFYIMESNYLMRDIDQFLDQIEIHPSLEVAKKLANYFDRSTRLLPNINAYRTRVVLSYVNWVEVGVEEKMLVFVSVEPCLRHCFPCFHPGLAFYLRDVAHFCAQAHFYADGINYLTEALDIMERIFIEHKAIPEMRTKLADLQRRNALQNASGKIKRLPVKLKVSLLPVLETPPASPSTSKEPKSSHGSSKERAQHRRIHRSATPLPSLASEEVQFSEAGDDDESIDFESVE